MTELNYKHFEDPGKWLNWSRETYTPRIYAERGVYVPIGSNSFITMVLNLVRETRIQGLNSEYFSHYFSEYFSHYF